MMMLNGDESITLSSFVVIVLYMQQLVCSLVRKHLIALYHAVGRISPSLLRDVRMYGCKY